VNHKQRAVISSYSDVSKLSSSVKIIHFRKFVSSKLFRIVLEECPNLMLVSMSKYASKRLSSSILEIILKRQIELSVSEFKGRPNLLVLSKNINMRYKLIGRLYGEDNIPG
jgi:hypothetical protein